MTERSRTEYSIVNIAASMGGYALNIMEAPRPMKRRFAN